MGNKIKIFSYLLTVFIVFLYCTGDRVKAESVSFIHTDHLGSSSITTDQDGSLISNQVYYPYGATRNDTGPNPTERQYTGQISDQDQTGLYYYNARYYDSLTAKFTQADRVTTEMNRYSYVSNRPMIYVDPTGFQPAPPCIGLEECVEANNEFKGHLENFRNQFTTVEWEKMSPIEQVQHVVDYISSNVHYSELFIRTWQTQNNAENELRGYQTMTGYLPSVDYFHEKAEEYEMIYQLSLESESLIWEDKKEKSIFGRYKAGLVVCEEFSYIATLSVMALVPEVDIFTITMNVAEGDGSHAMNAFIYDGEAYAFEPQGGPIMTLTDFMKVDPWGGTFDYRSMQVFTYFSGDPEDFYFYHDLALRDTGWGLQKTYVPFVSITNVK